MRRFFLSISAAALLCLIGAGGASARTTSCTGTISSGVRDQSLTIEGNVVIPVRASCLLVNIEIHGNLIVGAGATFLFSIHGDPIGFNGVSGNVWAIRAASVGIGWGHVDGSVIAIGTGNVELHRLRIVKNAIFVGNGSLSLFNAGIGRSAWCWNNGTVSFVDSSHAGLGFGQCKALAP
jgi:hypothetical protein